MRQKADENIVNPEVIEDHLRIPLGGVGFYLVPSGLERICTIGQQPRWRGSRCQEVLWRTVKKTGNRVKTEQVLREDRRESPLIRAKHKIDFFPPPEIKLHKTHILGFADSY